MRSLGATVMAFVLACGACGDDPMLHVEVEHPDGVSVARTVVTIYESSSLTCTDIAFSGVATTELDAARVAEQSVTSGGQVTGSLAGISRTDRKLVVARGYNSDDVWVTAGCEQHDEIVGDDHVTVATITTVNIAIVNEPPMMNDEKVVRLSVLDMRGNAVSGRRAGWTVYGPAGSSAMNSANVTSVSDGVWQPLHASCTGNDGIVALHPPPPSTVGGFAVQLRAEWAVQLPSLYTGFTASFAPTQLTATNASRKLCGVRKAGTTARLACIDGSVARDFELVVANGRGTLVSRSTQNIGADALAIVSVPRGMDRDVYLITTDGDYTPLFGAPAPVVAQPCSGCTVEDAMVVPPCGLQRARVLLQVAAATGSPIKQMNTDGTNLTDFPATTTSMQTVALDNGGCVTRLDPDGAADIQRQVITYHVETPVMPGVAIPTSTRAVYNCTSAMCLGNDLVVPGAGTGFHAGDEPRMIATAIDATGVVLTHLVMAQFTATRDRFIERERYPAAGVPERVITGHFDNDGVIDLFWNMSAARGTTFEVAYARQVGAQPLEALSGIQLVDVGSLDAADLNNDGLDEVIFVGDITTGTGSITGAVVIPMQMTAEAESIPVDAACAP